MFVTEALKNKPLTQRIILLCLKPFLQVQIYTRKRATSIMILYSHQIAFTPTAEQSRTGLTLCSRAFPEAELNLKLRGG